MPELDPEFKPVHIAYVKEINKRRHALSPQKTVRGNVITFVPERTIDRFNMPVYTGEIPYVKPRKSHLRKKQDSEIHEVSKYSQISRGYHRSARQVTLLWRNDYYQIKFPKFFTVYMIRDALYLLIKANLEETKFMVLPSQRRRSIFIGNKDMVNVSVGNGQALASESNTKEFGWGDPVIVSLPIRRKQRSRTLAA